MPTQRKNKSSLPKKIKISEKEWKSIPDNKEKFLEEKIAKLEIKYQYLAKKVVFLLEESKMDLKKRVSIFNLDKEEKAKLRAIGVKENKKNE